MKAAADRFGRIDVLMNNAGSFFERDTRVNAVSPGVIITPPALDELSGPRREWFNKVRETSAAKRFGTAEEVAAFLLDREAGFITEVDLLMDGGVTAALRAGELTTP
ncbi:hypothetical protein OK074_6190 [Actinobacteria bacterium OK074]|nr:hypothetical protein OK074_6190 [Actinobacteria bacterium OK074]